MMQHIIESLKATTAENSNLRKRNEFLESQARQYPERWIQRGEKQSFRDDKIEPGSTEKFGTLSWRRTRPSEELQSDTQGEVVPSSFDAAAALAQPKMYFNSAGQRLDMDLPQCDPEMINRVKAMKLCNRHYLTVCSHRPCKNSHDFRQLTAEESTALRRIARSVPCYNESPCRDRGCLYAHHCIYGIRCTKGLECRFAHITDEIVAEVC